MRIFVLVRLLEHAVLERVALAQRAIAMEVVVHPLIHRRRLLADRLQRRMRVQQRHSRRQAIVGNPIHANLPIIVRDILHQPLDAVVGVGGLVGRFRIVKVHIRRQFEHALRLESPAQVLDDENVAILRKFLPTRRHFGWSLVRNSVRRAAEQNGQRPALPGRRENHRLQAHAIPHRDHDFLKCKQRFSRRRLPKTSNRRSKNNPNRV